MVQFVCIQETKKDEEKNEEKAQQWEECSQVKFQQESILQVNTAPHQLIDKKCMENVINL